MDCAEMSFHEYEQHRKLFRLLESLTPEDLRRSQESEEFKKFMTELKESRERGKWRVMADPYPSCPCCRRY